jgi:hypothetical protein
MTSVDESVEGLKEIIQERVGIKPCEQRLIFSGKQLYDVYTLAKYGIDRERTLHLFLHLRGGDLGHVVLFADVTKLDNVVRFKI